ncbi:hypothetical protein BDV29DRAFT_114685 [Aspergillus leporis]|uniref:Uncharacterized protein n=1 Tax=Aspergillus leporis TaxID=41062 RepID=A0A5N5X2E4_9EURO|nr:hypothetical protein BDV29DRAFT_114685 [Aspergillus leporis]
MSANLKLYLDRRAVHCPEQHPKTGITRQPRWQSITRALTWSSLPHALPLPKQACSKSIDTLPCSCPGGSGSPLNELTEQEMIWKCKQNSWCECGTGWIRSRP